MLHPVIFRWFTASLASALLLAPALNDAKALGLTVATNQAVLMSEAGDEDAQDDVSACGRWCACPCACSTRGNAGGACLGRCRCIVTLGDAKTRAKGSG